MKSVLIKYSFLSVVILFLFTSCEKNEVSNITLNFTSASFSIGQTDSLIATTTGSGDLSKFPVTWSTSNSSVVTVTNGKIEGMADGKATVTAKAGTKSVSCDITVSNLIVPSTDKAYLFHMGDKFKSGISNYFEVYLLGSSDTVVLSFNLPLTVTDTLPVGTYNIQKNIAMKYVTDMSCLVPNTSNPSFTPDYIYVRGSLYVTKIFHYVVSGSIVVKSTNSNYSIEYTLLDQYGNTIFGTYLGKLEYRNIATSSAVAPQAIKGLSIQKCSEIKRIWK